MFLRSIKRKKNGKEHRYFSVVENRRLADGRTLQRHTEPEPRHEMLLERLGLTLPAQPPPRIRSGRLVGMPA